MLWTLPKFLLPAELFGILIAKYVTFYTVMLLNAQLNVWNNLSGGCITYHKFLKAAIYFSFSVTAFATLPKPRIPVAFPE